MKKIAYICAFSNREIQKRLSLKDLSSANRLRTLFGIPALKYVDSASWNTDIISSFEKYKGYEFYVISPHTGLKKSIQKFKMNGIHYAFYNQETSIYNRIKNKLFNWDIRTDFKHYRKLIKRILFDINPDVVVVCGAENPIYSNSVFDIEGKPILIILQTLLNSPKRIEMNVGTPYRRYIEAIILKNNKYFSVMEQEAYAFNNRNNPKSNCLSFNFPTQVTQTITNIEKDFDFVFFARGITKFKGVEDTIRAFAMLHKKYPYATLNISGGCDKTYMQNLLTLVESLGIKQVVSWHGHFELHSDVFVQLQKAKIVVIPGITAALNSTVKESMMLRLPTVVYETTATPEINKNNKCLFTAKMQDIEDLYETMLYAYENEQERNQVANNGYVYAHKNFSTEATGKKLIDTIEAVIENYYSDTKIPLSLLYKHE